MITILLPIYNGIEFINESVNSILNQTYDKWELLIGINGHSQNSSVFLKAKTFEHDSRIKVYDFYNIKGKVDTLNELLKYSSFDIIALIDVDDIWLKNKLHKQLNYINDYDVVGTNAHYFGNLQGVPNIPFYDISKMNFINSNPLINSSVILKKELCHWNETYNTGLEDYELWLRLRKEGKKFYNLPDILVRHRVYDDSHFNTQNHDLKMNELINKYI